MLRWRAGAHGGASGAGRTGHLCGQRCLAAKRNWRTFFRRYQIPKRGPRSLPEKIGKSQPTLDVQIEIIDGVNGYFDTYPSARITLSLSDFIRNIKGLVPRAANGGSTMGVQNSEMWIGSRDDNAQHYRERAQHNRERAQQLRELAVTMTSEENRKDLEWVAARYEALAKAAELLDSSGHTLPIDIAMLRPFRK
jgi:hypothetical protein